MKNYKYSLLVLIGLLLVSAAACKKNDGYNTTPISTDQTKPGIVTNVKVDNFNGGSYITYDLPNSENILYVLAQYSIRNGVSRETKSSYYTDTVLVNGFQQEADYNVTLYTVTRANVKSDPVTVTVHPATPIYKLVRPTLSLAPDFGGVNIKAANPLKKEVGIIVVAYDANTNTMEVQDQHFTRDAEIDYSLRGYNTDDREFGVYVTDQWGNISDTLKRTLNPLYEEMLNKSNFSEYNLPTDTKIYSGGGWPLTNLWDGNIGSGWHTDASTPPYTCTFNVGKLYKLSRFTMWERTGQFTYGHGNPRDFSLWGSNVASPRDAQLPISAPVGTVVGDWINMGNYNYPPPPSGFPPGSTISSDEAFVNAGVGFNVPFNAPSVRFMRLAVARTWGNASFAHVMELTFYGKPE